MSVCVLQNKVNYETPLTPIALRPAGIQEKLRKVEGDTLFKVPLPRRP